MKAKSGSQNQTTERGLSVTWRGWFAGRATDANLHFHARAEAVEDGHEPVHCEAGEAGIADAREVRRRDSGTVVGCADGEAVAVEGFDDFSGKDGFELLDIRIRVASAGI